MKTAGEAGGVLKFTDKKTQTKPPPKQIPQTTHPQIVHFLPLIYVKDEEEEEKRRLLWQIDENQFSQLMLANHTCLLRCRAFFPLLTFFI